MTKKRKNGRPSLNYPFAKIKPGKSKVIKTNNISSCQRLALYYAKKNGISFKTKALPDGLLVIHID